MIDRQISTIRRMMVIAGAVLMAAPLRAQSSAADDGARPISLREAVDLAQRYSPAIVSAKGLERVGLAQRNHSQ